MMATISWVVFKHHKKADGTYNPKIRIIHNRTVAYMATQIYTPLVRFKRGCAIGVVTDGSIEDSLNLRVKDLRKLVNTYDYIIDECENAKAVFSFLEKKLNESKELDFIQFADQCIAGMKDNGSRKTAVNMLANLRNYIDGDYLPVKKITSSFLVRFENWMRAPHYLKKRGERLLQKPLKASTIRTYMASLQIIYNKMLLHYNDYEIGDIVITGDPFRKYTPPKATTFVKKAVDASVIRKIADYTPSRARHTCAELARDMFLLSFCLAGMNPIDLLTCDTYKNGRIDYCRTKTKNAKKDNAFISVPVPLEVQGIFDRHRDPEGKRVFGFYHSYRDITFMRASLSAGMKIMCSELGLEPITLYAARHSFATIARNDCDVSMDDIALCLTHVSGHSITDTYVKSDFSRVDTVVRKVMDYVFHAGS